MRLAPGEYFFEDMRPGDYFETGGVTVTETHVVTFAGLAGDLFDLHMDEAFAREQGFDGRVAHGLLGLSLLDGLKTRCPVRLMMVAALSWNWSFTGPIYPGDRVHGRFEIAATRPTRDGRRGIVTLSACLINRSGTVVQQGDHVAMARLREPATPETETR